MTTAPRIICRAGPSLDALSPVDVNRTPIHIDGPHFEGDVAVRLKDYRGPRSEEGKFVRQPEQAFMGEGDTWSISFQGRWKDEVNADDVLFGNVWQKPIKSYLPYGTSAALRFMRYIDPSMDCDLYADKPWALSPLFATLQYLSAREASASEGLTSKFIPDAFPEDISPLVPASDADSLRDKPSARQSYFTKAPNRTATKFGPSDLIRGDFSHGFLNFDTLSVSLPGGLSFSLAKYWNGEPVVFSCQKRGTGETFFVVSFTLENDDGGEVPVQEGKGEHDQEEKEGGAFSFAGTELVGLAATETPNPRKALPTAVKGTFWRVSVIYLTTLLIIGLNVPYNNETLLGGGSGAGTSPFVIMAKLAGLNGLDHLLNITVCISVLSIGLSCVYAGSRVLVLLAAGPIAYINCAAAGDTIFNWLLALSGLSTLLKWGSICMCHIRFRKAWRVQGHSVDELPFRALGGVYGSWLGFILVCLVLIAQFYTAVWPIGGAPSNPSKAAETFFLSYLAAPVVITLYIIAFLMLRTFPKKAHEIDLDTGRKSWFTAEEMNEWRAERKMAPWYTRIYRMLFTQ